MYCESIRVPCLEFSSPSAQPEKPTRLRPHVDGQPSDRSLAAEPGERARRGACHAAFATPAPQARASGRAGRARWCSACSMEVYERRSGLRELGTCATDTSSFGHARAPQALGMPDGGVRSQLRLNEPGFMGSRLSLTARRLRVECGTCHALRHIARRPDGSRPLRVLMQT